MIELKNLFQRRPFKEICFLCLSFCALEQREIRQQLAEKAKAGELKVVNGAASQPPSKRKRRWDQTADQTPGATPKKLSSWDQAEVIILAFISLSAQDIISAEPLEFHKFHSVLKKE